MINRGTGAAVDSPPLTPAADEPPPPIGGRPSWIRYAVLVVLAGCVALRFLASSPLWLDEAQTVDIAHRSVPHLFTALRHDGSPPLYYLILHGWMSVFGTSNFAVRAPSGIFSVAALPVVWFVARRFGLSRDGAWVAVLLLATSPFAVRFATETRMYSLELLLVLLAMWAFERAWAAGSRPAMAAAAVVTGALVLTHYWSIFMVAVVGAGALVLIARGERRGWWVLIPLAVGCLAFVPWLPTFAYQSAHTGAPWGPPPALTQPLLFLRSYAGGGIAAPLLNVAFYLLVVIALVGYPMAAPGITFRPPLRRTPLFLIALAVVTMAVAVVASKISSSAYASRYSMLVLAPVLLVVAIGLLVLPPRIAVAAVAVVCAFGLIDDAGVPTRLRTQAGQVATILSAATPRDLVVFCPDQLGPAVHRIAPNAGTQVVYPTFGSPAMVDWVDYEKRNHAADPNAFAREALRRAAGHTIWLIYETGYPTLAGGCTSLYTSFTAARGSPTNELKPHAAFEKYAVARFS